MWNMDSDSTSDRTLDKIVELETALKAKVDAAQSRAAAEFSEAEIVAQKILEDKSEVTALAEEARTRIRAEGEKKLAELKAQSEQQRDELRKRLSGNISTTVDFILNSLCTSDVAKKSS